LLSLMPPISFGTYYRGEGDFARFRYRLTSIVPALRAR
jgi:hypothetical protein